MEIPIYNCQIEDKDDATGVYAMSFVDCPANEVDFITLGRHPHPVQLRRDNHKQILTGVVLQPEQLIYRHSPQLGEHYIKFSAVEIEKIAHKMMRTGIALHNTTHQHSTPLEGNYLTELWIVENPGTDKAKALGFDNLPKGTLMCSYKVSDTAYWQQQVMTGNVKGFSLEGFFNQQIEIKNKPIKQKHVKMNDRRKKTSLLGKISRMWFDIQTVQKADVTASGEAFIVFVLADGKEVYIDQDGFATLDEEQMAGGEHILADGNMLIIDEQGQFVETRESSEKTNKPAEATPPQTLAQARIRRNKLAGFDPKTGEALKAKIAEMQSTIDQLLTALDEAQGMLENTQGEVEEMRRKMPSARPVAQRMSFASSTTMTTAERMAVALNQTIHRRK